MPYIPNTPESLLSRSDSKNPLKTCLGITVNGQPCRRGLPRGSSIGRVDEDSITDTIDPQRFFCFQHKDQAEERVAQLRRQLTALSQRSSTDTLVQRFGMLSVNEPQRKQNRKAAKERLEDRRLPAKPRRNASKSNFLGRLCCFGGSDEDYLEVIRHSKRAQQHSSKPKANSMTTQQQEGDGNNAFQKPNRNSLPNHKDLVPDSLSPAIASSLRTEMAKPLSQSEEDGFIYMFWLTADAGKPSSNLVSSLLSDEPTTRKQQPPESGRHQNPSLDSHRHLPEPPSKLLVKIGRTTNVHRRLNSWSRQCGYDLTLIRFYPYHKLPPAMIDSQMPAGEQSQSSTTDPFLQKTLSGVRKMPHVHRVERLIHIELAEKRVRQDTCEVCSKKHREWFEIDATRQALRAVDGVCRKWTDWVEHNYGQ